jgi:gluconolactonase
MQSGYCHAGFTIFARGFEFPEGPAFDRYGLLYLVNLRGGYVSRVSPAGEVEKFASTGGAPNGSAFHPGGDLYVADSGLNSILAIDQTGKVREVCRAYRGEKFQAPNDLCFDRAGGLYFTDPPPVTNPNPIGRLFYLNTAGEPDLLDEGIAYSNGLALDATEENLYVVETRTGRILRYQVQGPGQLGPRQVFAQLEPKPDGLALDAAGRLYVAVFGSGAIWVVGPDGHLVGKLALGGSGPTNLAFGGKERRQLFVTEGPQGIIYRLDMETPGLKLAGD